MSAASALLAVAGPSRRSSGPAATSLAAARLLLAGQADDAVEIVLPKGQRVMMRLEFCRTTADGAEAGTIKDAGDDPDVTHGALIFARVALAALPPPETGADGGSVFDDGHRSEDDEDE